VSATWDVIVFAVVIGLGVLIAIRLTR